MPSIYIQPSDYATYGLDPATTTQDQIIRASDTINSYLGRPEGLIYSIDGQGNPCYMTSLETGFSLTVTSGAIAPGNTVEITVNIPSSRVQIGEVLILDRANPSLTEAVIVNSITGNTIILQSVKFNHNVNALLEFDLCIVEEINLPDDRQETILHNTPIAAILGGQGQFGYPRRGSSFKFDYSQYSLLPILTQFGGPPIWQTFDILPNSFDASTGRIWLSPSIYLAYYTQARIYYIAGWTYASLPSQIKTACASIVNSYNELPVSGSFKTLKQGDTSITRWGDTILDADVKSMLSPYTSNTFV